MSLAVDETAGDLPVRDVGLVRGGLMPAITDTVRDRKSWKKPQVLKIKDRQRVFRVPREQLEDQCLHLQEENNLLRQHTHTQEQRLRRMSTKLMRLHQGRPAGLRDGDQEETILELEARVATLESQKGALQNKLSLARQHILDLGGHTHYRLLCRGRALEGEGGVRRAAQTAPPRYGGAGQEEAQQRRLLELEELAVSLREKEKEVEGAVREMRREQAEGHRLTIRENVDVIRLQKQLSERSSALRLTQEKFNHLQEAYETQLEQSQAALKESQAALLERVEELSLQLKQERQRSLLLEGQLSAATLSLQALEEFQERVSDLEGERRLLKESYDSLLGSTLSAQSQHEEKEDKEKNLEREREREKEEIWRTDIRRLEEILQEEREERGRLEEEKERMRLEKERITEQMEGEKEATAFMRANHEHLEQEVLHYRSQVTSLQDRLDSVTKEFDMSVEDLSETLLQIKTFRLQQEGREGLRLLLHDGKGAELSGERVEARASHAEAVLELQKSRDMLLLQHRINTDLQAEMKTMMERSEREREESRRRMEEKDKLLGRRALQINTLQAQLKELAYSPRNYKRTVPLQYIWPGGDREVLQPIEDDTTFSQLRPGESVLEIHLRGATFTPGGLRTMGGAWEGSGGVKEVVTFCTYALLDFEMHSTPLVTGTQPNYGFTSRYPLSPRDLSQLGGQGGGVRVELHQAVGGVRFVTRGRAQVPLGGAGQRRGERVSGRVNVTGSEGEVIGVLDFWVRLFPPAEPMDTPLERGADWLIDRRAAVTQRSPAQRSLGWPASTHEREMFDYGGGIPNELEVVMERCVGLSARWPGLLPDAYLMYRLYDLAAHASLPVPCCADPLFNDAVSYPLAVTGDVLEYLRTGSLWVYLFDDSDDQMPPSYLAKTPVPLRPLAKGKQIKGDYVLRDAGGGPRGLVRVSIRWKYPFQPPEEAQEPRELDQAERETEGGEKEVERRSERDEEPLRPVARPRVKPKPTPIKLHRPQDIQSEAAAPVSSPEPRGATPLQSPARKRATPLRSPDLPHAPPLLILDTSQTTPSRYPTRKGQGQATPSRSPTRKGQGQATPSRPPTRKQAVTSRAGSARSARSSVSDDMTLQDVASLEQASRKDETSEKASDKDSDNLGSAESRSSSQSDVIVMPRPSKPIRKGDKLRVEILSLSFGPTSQVALDQSVQRIYVEYRLLGVPMETTETPMSLRKPTEGEEVHFNFTRVIYVDSSAACPLRQYLYTMLEGTDPHHGRLKFTVVSEPMDEQEDCVDVGIAFLDLQEMLTGNDIIERQIDIVSLDEDREVMGKLKVSVEAAKVLTGIYWEFHRQTVNRDDEEDKTGEEEEEDEEEEEKEDEEEEEKEDISKENQIQVMSYDDDDSDFD